LCGELELTLRVERSVWKNNTGYYYISLRNTQRYTNESDIATGPAIGVATAFNGDYIKAIDELCASLSNTWVVCEDAGGARRLRVETIERGDLLILQTEKHDCGLD
jgi:hypothetical protein